MCIRDRGAHHPYELQIVHQALAVPKIDGSVYMALGQHVLGAVSYTHLDVYKRQNQS